MLSRGNILESELTVPGRETIFTRARMKEHSILDNLAISDLQIITESSRSGRKFKPKLCVYRWDTVGVKVVSAVYHTTLRKELRNERF